MPWIFQYFWFICAAFMMVNIAIWRRRIAVAVERGNASAEELDRFTRWTTIILVGGSLVFGLISLAAGWSTPFCAGILSFSNGWRALASLLTLGSWVLLLWWVWRGNGASFLARVGPALKQRPDYDAAWSPRAVRLVVTAVALASSIGSAMTWPNMPAPAALGCSAGRVAP